jgi:16S rRNA pseudouridine516 synthase
MRLDKFISHATSMPRDHSKRVVRNKRITVNGKMIRSAAHQVAEDDAVCLDGQPLQLPQPRYYMLHKPEGYVCATQDSEHPIVLDLLNDMDVSGLSIAGRLDIDTTGLVLISDDGQWLHRVTSPRHLFAKVYLASLQEPVNEDTIAQFERGILLRGEDKVTAPALCKVLADKQAQVTLSEGRYHQVKRMFAACGNHVVALHRHKIGAVTLDESLAPGAYRSLTQEEIESFQL